MENTQQKNKENNPKIKNMQKKLFEKNNHDKETKTKNTFLHKIQFFQKFKLAIALFVFITFLAIPVFALQNLMALEGVAEFNGTKINNGNLAVLIYNESVGGVPIYNSSTDYIGVINNGRFDVMLGDKTKQLVLEYGKIYYMDISINEQDIDFNNSERKKFQSSMGNISGNYIFSNSITSINILNGTITDADINLSANINKAKISTELTWLESEIPSLTALWQGTLDYSRILNQNLMNVNSSVYSLYSQYLGGIGIDAILNNDSTLNNRITLLNNITTSLNDSITALNDTIISLNNSITSLNSSKAEIGNCVAGMVVQNITTNGVECIETQSSSEINIELSDLFSRQYYRRIAMFESVTAAYNEPWAPVAIALGTTTLVAGTANHPGVASLRSSANVSSGYSFQISGTTTYLLDSDYTTQTSFKPFAKTGNVTNIKFGFMDVFTINLPVDAVYFNISQIDSVNFTVMGIARNNNAQTKTSSNYLIKSGTWYGLEIYINSPTLATFNLYNETELLWTDTVASNIPTTTGRETSNAFIAHTIGGTTLQTLAYIDYISVGINRTLER